MTLPSFRVLTIPDVSCHAARRDPRHPVGGPMAQLPLGKLLDENADVAERPECVVQVRA